MAEHAFFANSGALMVSTATGGTTGDATDEIGIAALKGVEMSPSFEHVELYGMESVQRLAVAKHSLKVKVSCKYAMWDPSADYILNYVMTGGGATTSFTMDSTAGTGVDNSCNKNQVALFTMTATMNPHDSCSLYYSITAHGVYFEGVPFGMSENEFIVRDLSGTAKYITIAKSASGW